MGFRFPPEAVLKVWNWGVHSSGTMWCSDWICQYCGPRGAKTVLKNALSIHSPRQRDESIPVTATVRLFRRFLLSAVSAAAAAMSILFFSSGFWYLEFPQLENTRKILLICMSGGLKNNVADYISRFWKQYRVSIIAEGKIYPNGMRVPSGIQHIRVQSEHIWVCILIGDPQPMGRRW